MEHLIAKLAGPVATIIAAIVAAFFVRRQALTAEKQAETSIDQLRYSFFEKRWEIYEKTKSLILLMVNDSPKDGFSAFDVAPYYIAIDEAAFFFSSEVCNWMQEVKKECQATLLALSTRMEKPDQYWDSLNKLVKRRNEMPNRFEKELQFRQLTKPTAPSLSWKRGFLRMWIVASILWVSFVGWQLDPVHEIQEARAPVVFHFGDDEVQFPGGIDVAVVRGALTKLGQSEVSKQPAPAWALSEDVGTFVNRTVGAYQPTSLWKLIAAFFGAAASLPLIAVLGWFVTEWIVKGFRPLQKSST